MLRTDNESPHLCVGSVEEYTEALAAIRSQIPYPDLVFRGQADKNWQLDSSAERYLRTFLESGEDPTNRSFIDYLEKIIEDYRSGVSDQSDWGRRTELEVLATLQHYHIPTCLIDFTRNSLVALWFACGTARHGQSTDGQVFVVDIAPSNDSILHLDSFAEITPERTYIPVRTLLSFDFDSSGQADHVERYGHYMPLDREGFQNWFWAPMNIDLRIVAQQSVFILGPISSRRFDARKIVIESQKKEEILHELSDLYGIDSEYLFPADMTYGDFSGLTAPFKLNMTTESVRQGVRYAQREEWQEAISKFGEADASESNSATIRHFRGAALFNLGRLREAVTEYSMAIREGVADYTLYRDRGFVYYLLEEWDDCIEDLNVAIRHDTSDAITHYYLGQSYLSTGDVEKGLKHVDKAIELEPNDPFFIGGRGQYYTDAGEWQKAIDDLNVAIEADPNDAKNWRCRGVSYWHIGNREQALQDMSKAIEKDPHLASFYSLRAHMYLQFSGVEKRLELLNMALEDLNTAIELEPHSALYHHSRAMVYRYLDDVESAIEDYTESIALNQDQWSGLSHLYRGILYMRRGKWERARSDLHEAQTDGVPIAIFFETDFGSVESFERDYSIEIPSDLAETLSG